MNKDAVFRRITRVFLLIIVLPFLSSAYKPGNLTFFLFAGSVQALLIGVAAWSLARSNSIDQMSLIAAFLLLANWAVVSLALNMEAPPQGQDWLNTIPNQQVRYSALVVGSLICFGGLAVIAARLRDAGQTVLASLGFASVTISTVLFIFLFLAYPIVMTLRFEQESILGEPPPWWAFFSAYARSVGLVHRFCAYLGALLFVIALRKCELISRSVGIGVGGFTLFAGIISTFIHLPPAVAFVPPYLMGVSLIAGTPKSK